MPAALAAPKSLKGQVLEEQKRVLQALVKLLELQKFARFYVWMHTLAHSW